MHSSVWSNLRAINVPISPSDADPPEVSFFNVGTPRFEASFRSRAIEASSIPVLLPVNTAVAVETARAILGDDLANR